MQLSFIASLTFLLGAYCGILLLIPFKTLLAERQKLFSSLAWSILMIISGAICGIYSTERDADIPAVINLSIGLGAITFAYVSALKFKDVIFPRINELTLLGLTLSGICLLFFKDANLLIILLLSFPLTISIVFGFIPVLITKRWQIFLYILYLFILISLTLYSISISSVATILSKELPILQMMISVFVFGTIFFHIGTHVGYIFSLLSITEPENAIERAKYREDLAWHRYDFGERFSIQQYGFKWNILVAMLTVTIFMITNYFAGAQTSLLITILFMGTGLSKKVIVKFGFKESDFADQIYPSNQEGHLSASLVIIPIILAYTTIILLILYFSPELFANEFDNMIHWLNNPIN